MEPMQIISIANQKGGAGKTTTAAAIGAQIAQAGKRVLLVDIDPQASLSQGLGIDAPGASMAEVIGGATRGTLQLGKIIKPVMAGLDIAPSDIALAAAELGLVSRIGRENVIRQAISQAQGYDLILLDCPPALSLLTIGALVASRLVIVPTLPTAADLRGVRLFLDTIEQAKELNPALELRGLVVVQYDERMNAHRDALEEIKAAGLPVLATIPRSVKAQEATAARQPVTVYAPDSKPSEAYKLLSRKVIKWLGNQQ
jgi:chromosome partitioning protein